MVVNLDQVFDAILKEEGIDILNGPRRKYLVVIPYLGSKLPGKELLYFGKNITEKFQEERLDVTHYKQTNVDFQVCKDLWKDFYDYNKNENDIDDSMRQYEYLISYKKGLQQLGRNNRGLFVYYYKQIQ